MTTESKPGIDEPRDLVSDSLDRSRGENALFMNRARFGLALLFLLLYGFAIFILKETALRHTGPHILLWSAAATALWIWGKRSPPVLNLSRFAVPLLDIPMATWIQHTNVQNSEHGQTTAIYTLGLFVFLVAMSSFSLRSRHLILTGLVATFGLLIVYFTADVSAVSFVSGPILILAAAAMMSWFPARQKNLIRDAANRQIMRNRLARYFSPGVAEVIEDRDDPGEGESCEITVLFCDIRGFTRLSENLEAREVVRLLNNFHGHMVDEIFHYGGTLDKYLGDGLLAWFNAPVRQADHAVRAVQCALSMVDSLAKLNQTREAAGDEPLGIGIGVHAGNAVVGNIGASHRREFTAIGDTVNVASRLEALTRQHETEILISEAVRQRIDDPARHGFLLESCGDAAVRGRQQSVEIFSPGWIEKSAAE